MKLIGFKAQNLSRPWQRKSKLATALVCLLLASMACNPAKFETKKVNKNVVCDPFGGHHELGNDAGVVSSLYYLADTTQTYSNVDQYFQFGINSGADIYMSQINVPTHLFSQGFRDGDGQLLKKQDGDTLFEWFALQMKGQILLTPSQPNGLYQFALLSDDGTILTINDPTPRTLIDNDSVHPTRFKIATTPVSLSQSQPVPFDLKYFQGPRFHISVILMMRPWTASYQDPADGVTSNDNWFDYSVDPPSPKQAYLDLLSRGWKPLSAENFILPPGYSNPCN